MKNFMSFTFFFIFLINISCTSNKDSSSNVTVGNDKDKNGCIGSAGYVWSYILKDCVRFFEVGVVYESIENDLENKSKHVSNAFVIYSKDKSKVELFITESKESIILERNINDKNINGYYYNDKEGIEMVFKENISYIIINGVIKYTKKI